MKGSLYSSEVVEPYAQALMSVAQSHDDLTEELGNQLRSLAQLLTDSQDLRDFVGNPVVAAEDKKALLERILGEDASPYLINFIRLLVDKRRIVYLEAVCQEYLALLRKLNQTVLAQVTSATELDEQQQQAVADQVQKLTGAQAVELELKTDPDLIGGVIVKVGSQVFDASLRGQLRRISMRLSSAN